MLNAHVLQSHKTNLLFICSNCIFCIKCPIKRKKIPEQRNVVNYSQCTKIFVRHVFWNVLPVQKMCTFCCKLIRCTCTWCNSSRQKKRALTLVLMGGGLMCPQSVFIFFPKISPPDQTLRPTCKFLILGLLYHEFFFLLKI